MRRLGNITLFVVLAIAALGFAVSPASAEGGDNGPEYREIHFPADGAVSFSDDFGAARVGHTHEGNDLMGTKLQKEVAATDGIVSVRPDTTGTSGNMLTIRDADGWTYRYMHINNDTPGTDDGLNPTEWMFAPGITNGSKVKQGDFVAYMGDSGNAETTGPHLHFEVRRPDGTAIDPWTSLRLAKGLPAGTRCSYGSNPKATPSAAAGAGYYVLGSDGGIFSFGTAPFYGSVPGLGLPAKVTALRLATTKSTKGYTILGADGGIFTFGDADFFGSVPGSGVKTKALDLRMTPTGKGYWVLGEDGGVFSFGDADFFGSVPGLGISAKAIRLVPTPSGKGYWVLGADGGVFSFGDAAFAGSVPGAGVATTVVAMTSAPKSAGYWVLGSDGGVFSFGVPFYGSIPGAGLCKWPAGVQMKSSSTGKGYWVVGNDGSVFAFGDAPAYGGVPGLALGAPVKAVDLDPVLPVVATKR